MEDVCLDNNSVAPGGTGGREPIEAIDKAKIMADNVEEKLNALVARVGKVRRWLVTLAILKVAALCLIFVSLYVGVYAWLDHRLNFDEIARISAFILLVGGLAFLLRRLTKLLFSHISCSIAANYIENKRSFNQQLVTAIEYYENKQDYPYSKALAEQLVLRVDKESVEFKFDSTVKKWQGYVLGAVILFGLVAATFYVRDNYVYFSSYFARLMSPLASVDRGFYLCRFVHRGDGFCCTCSCR